MAGSDYVDKMGMPGKRRVVSLFPKRPQIIGRKWAPVPVVVGCDWDSPQMVELSRWGPGTRFPWVGNVYDWVHLYFRPERLVITAASFYERDTPEGVERVKFAERVATRTRGDFVDTAKGGSFLVDGGGTSGDAGLRVGVSAVVDIGGAPAIPEEERLNLRLDEPDKMHALKVLPDISAGVLVSSLDDGGMTQFSITSEPADFLNWSLCGWCRVMVEKAPSYLPDGTVSMVARGIYFPLFKQTYFEACNIGDWMTRRVYLEIDYVPFALEPWNPEQAAKCYTGNSFGRRAPEAIPAGVIYQGGRAYNLMTEDPPISLGN